jgi:NCS1 family nucleobase:cation symporter-1
MTRVVVAVLSLLGVAVATISTNIAANVVSPANDFAQIAPRLISFRTGGVITGVIGILIMPWKLLASADTYIFDWLVGYSALLGPIAGIMIVDYWYLRRRELDVPDLYRTTGRYTGTNWVAILALVAGVAPNVPGFLRSVHVLEGPPSFLDDLYPYAWFIGLAIASIAYAVGMRIRPGFGVPER